jgi:hypothetical protein
VFSIFWGDGNDWLPPYQGGEVLLSLDEWQHLVYVATENTLDVYLNGENRGSYEHNTKFVAYVAENLKIAQGNNGDGNEYNAKFFAGGVRDLRIYNTAISQDQVKSIMLGQANGDIQDAVDSQSAIKSPKQ